MDFYYYHFQSFWQLEIMEIWQQGPLACVKIIAFDNGLENSIVRLCDLLETRVATFAP